MPIGPCGTETGTWSASSGLFGDVLSVGTWQNNRRFSFLLSGLKNIFGFRTGLSWSQVLSPPLEFDRYSTAASRLVTPFPQWGCLSGSEPYKWPVRFNTLISRKWPRLVGRYKEGLPNDPFVTGSRQKQVLLLPVRQRSPVLFQIHHNHFCFHL